MSAQVEIRYHAQTRLRQFESTRQGGQATFLELRTG